jgi:YidC/Oxa1 family membrane protein insertase
MDSESDKEFVTFTMRRVLEEEMEIRALIGVILCFLVLLLFFNYFSPAPVRQPAPPAEVVAPKQEEPSQTPTVQKIEPAPPTIPQVVPRSGKVVTPLHEIGWNSLHGSLAKVVLTERKGDKYKYPDEGRKNPLTLLQSEGELDDILLLIDPATGKDISQSGYMAVEEKGKESEAVTFKSVLPTNVSVTKKFLFQRNSYHLIFEVEFSNLSNATVPVGYELLLSRGIVLEVEQVSGGAVVAQGSAPSIDLSEISPREIRRKEKIEYTGTVAWAGIVNRYFACVLCPGDPATRSAINTVRILPALTAAPNQKENADFFSIQTSKEDGTPAELKMLNVSVSFKSKVVELPPGKSITHSYLLYLGPKDARILDRYADHGLSKLVNYGWFEFLSKLFLWILRGIYFLIPNYGIAIIVLTLIVRGGLHPISRKQQSSFMKHQQVMAKLQPQLAKLKEKYKNNKQKFYVESSKLYKEHGASVFPAGGCLLLLLQFPVFIGLYWALSLSIELRQAPFFWWIQDLSRPDGAHLPRLGFSIPLLGTDMLNILPIFMVAVMVIQNIMQPKAADPQQAQSQKISMYFMAFFLSFIFYSLPSGLVLYFLISSAIGVLESYIIRRSLQAMQPATTG